MSSDSPRASTYRPKTAILILLVAVTALVALVALVATKRADTPNPLVPNPLVLKPLVLKLDRFEPCRGNPWIGILKDDGRSCPAGWKSLFALPPDDAAEQYRTAAYQDDVRHPNDDALPPGLRRFCMIADQKESRGLKPRSEVLERIEQDCSVIGGAADTFFPIGDFDKPLRGRFLQQAGRPDPAQSFEAPPEAVRLVIIDSASDIPGDLNQDTLNDQECPAAPGTGALECSAHGWALARLARDLLCSDDPSENCVVEIGARRALRGTYEIQERGSKGNPLEPKRVELPLTGGATGGRYGDQKDLARAIWREVDNWRNKQPRPKLILNLAVGWEEIYGDAPSVRAAIEDAVCRGVLVLAAAGNRIAGPVGIGEIPILPGAWEQDPAPSESECKSLLEDSFVEQPQKSKEQLEEKSAGQTQGSDEDYRPLLHAVGGVQMDDRPMSNSRPHATPRIVAYGDHVPVVYSGGNRRETLTGTSVSTLVVAAAAAVQWRKDSGQKSFEVMQALWQGGERVSQPVDFCLGSPCPVAKRVFVGSRREATDPWPPVIRKPATIPLAAFPRSKTLEDCAPQTLHYDAEPPPGANLCPQRWANDIAAQAMVVPQPGTNHNPNCTIEVNSPGTLLLEFHQRFRVGGTPAELSDLTLVAGDRAYRLPEKTLLLGEPGSELQQLVFKEMPLLTGDPYPLYLAAIVNGKYATITPILLVQGKDGPTAASD